MEKTLEEAMQANVAAREKMVALLNSMTLDPLPFAPNSFNPQVAKFTSSLLGEAVANTGKDMSIVPRDVSAIASSEVFFFRCPLSLKM